MTGSTPGVLHNLTQAERSKQEEAMLETFCIIVVGSMLAGCFLEF